VIRAIRVLSITVHLRSTIGAIIALKPWPPGGGYKSVVLAIFSRPGFHQRPDEVVATPHEMAATNGESPWPGDSGLGPSLRSRRYALRVRGEWLTDRRPDLTRLPTLGEPVATETSDANKGN
jgi:hypothetical protein